MESLLILMNSNTSARKTTTALITVAEFAMMLNIVRLIDQPLIKSNIIRVILLEFWKFSMNTTMIIIVTTFN